MTELDTLTDDKEPGSKVGQGYSINAEELPLQNPDSN